MGWARGKDNRVEDFESSEIVLYYTTTVDPVYIHSNSLNLHYTTLVMDETKEVCRQKVH